MDHGVDQAKWTESRACFKVVFCLNYRVLLQHYQKLRQRSGVHLHRYRNSKGFYFGIRHPSCTLKYYSKSISNVLMRQRTEGT